MLSLIWYFLSAHAAAFFLAVAVVAVAGVVVANVVGWWLLGWLAGWQMEK